jgi:drug/metabolite transporter (DMT)-like permease
MLSFIGLFGFGALWGSTIPMAKVAVSTGHSPLGLIFWEMVIVFAILGSIIWMRGYAVRFKRKHLEYYVLIGLIGTIVPGMFSFTAAAHLPAGIMALVITTVPMFSLAIALLLGNERFSPLRILGITLGVTAMAMIAFPEASLPEKAMIAWLPIAMVAPVCYGFEGNFISSRAPRDIAPISALWGSSITGMAISGPIAFLGGYWVDIFKPWEAAEWALLGSSVGHSFAYAGYMWLVGTSGVVFSSQIAYLVTTSAIVFSIVFLGEHYSFWVWGAVGLMLFALTLVQPVGKLPEVKAAVE